MSRMDEILSNVEENLERYIRYVEDLIRQPSISAQKIGISECANLVLEMMKQLGLRAEILPTKGNPIVYAQRKFPTAKRTILFYNHYDVQPPDPLDKWVSDPFKPERRNGSLYGRGAADNKGNLTSRMAALESVINVIGECPVNVKFLVDGEEEIGSPNLTSFAEEHRKQLEADAIIWEGGVRDISERPTITLGYKGILIAELSTRGPKTDQPSGKAPILSNPVWRLVWALNSMKSSNGRIRIEGFYDRVSSASKQTRALLTAIPFDLERERNIVGSAGGARSEDPSKIKKEYFFGPTLNIDGFTAGYTGEGVKTIVPSEASAKIDIRLVPDQDPDDTLRKIQRHLTNNGFNDIEVKTLGKFYPCQTNPRAPIVTTTVETARQVYGSEPIVYPMSPYSSGMHVAVSVLGKPAVAIGADYYGSNFHGPNEHIRINDYLLAIKHIATILLTFK